MRHNIKTKAISPRKVTSFLRLMKDDLSLKTPDIYSIPCKCGKVYTGQIRHSPETRMKEHHHHIRLYHLDKSAVAKHSINFGHHIQFQDTSILAKKARHMECTIREATEIDLQPDNKNREEGFFLSKSWKHLFQTLKKGLL